MYPTGVMLAAVKKHTGKRMGKARLTLVKRAIEALEPAGKSLIAWDDKLIRFGVCVQPSCTNTKSILCNLFGMCSMN